jgi:hypothetical protein
MTDWTQKKQLSRTKEIIDVSQCVRNMASKVASTDSAPAAFSPARRWQTSWAFASPQFTNWGAKACYRDNSMATSNGVYMRHPTAPVYSEAAVEDTVPSGPN